MIESLEIELPVKCVCGGKNAMYEDFINDRYIIECECDTKLTIGAGEWKELYMKADRRNR